MTRISEVPIEFSVTKLFAPNEPGKSMFDWKWRPNRTVVSLQDICSSSEEDITFILLCSCGVNCYSVSNLTEVSYDMENLLRIVESFEVSIL